jgi:hypothetical protein
MGWHSPGRRGLILQLAYVGVVRRRFQRPLSVMAARVLTGSYDHRRRMSTRLTGRAAATLSAAPGPGIEMTYVDIHGQPVHE